ncbi:23S rRNA (guanosine(2251)-2'-O)-methyltransferase RlmB [Halotalea alkalilenta]|uniref:23S rRNA (guanosine-2'-O-)-methyltransferase RlmB n=1 Tax=Halotalea alkalilenta TaxID=376489 RepID=A0A172YH36_9GAMM|nr:23S rRNA (guanosine(2251)-2'-O)-methyltransferase RlmB [Halotalea alkalilenta]ANF58579.1 23S rRNA (guanosine(2251)-2'-O)-methyltransferase RlmB [Halotalea alkalilenta]
MARRHQNLSRRTPGAEGVTAKRPARAAGASPVPPKGCEAVYGVHSVEALLSVENDRVEPPRQLWIQEGDAGERLAQLCAIASERGIDIQRSSREALDAVAQGGNHQGVVAFCPPLVAEAEQSLLWRLDDWREARPALLLVLDGVTDPHNLGACLRCVDAAGAHGVIVAKDRAAPLNATVRKVASGAAEAVPVYQVTNLARTLETLRSQGVWVYGTAGEATQSLFEVDLRGPCALVMGAEGKGLRRLTRERCDALVKLPMAGRVSSLNVSVAAGIGLFEAVRQRG